MAGWIALRFVHDPLLAVPHFEASRIAGFPRTEARAAYWLGPRQAGGWRVEGGAALSSRRPPSRFYTYYGGLARQAVQRANVCEFRAPRGAVGARRLPRS